MDVSFDLLDGGLLQEGASFQHEVVTLLLSLSKGSLLRLFGLDLLEQGRVLCLVEVGLLTMLEDLYRRVRAKGDQERSLNVGGAVDSSRSFLDRRRADLLDLHGECRLDVSSF